MSAISIIVAVLVGAFIGWITNHVAIKMLFRPLTAKRIFGWRIPGTPGVIPRNRVELAQGMANIVAHKLLTPETLGKRLLSEEMITKMEGFVNTHVKKLYQKNPTLGEFINSIFGEQTLTEVGAYLKSDLTGVVGTRLSDPELAQSLTDKIIEQVTVKVDNPLIKMAIPMFKDTLVSSVSHFLSEQGTPMVMSLATEQGKNFLDMKMSDVIDKYKSQVENLIEGMVELYRKIVKEQLPRMLNNLDISMLVKNEVENMDVMRLEEIVLEVMRKHLNFIEYIGAALGAILGLINVLVGQFL
ncbi:MAG: DUF445 family protein [Bacteroidales bacterium]|nr:DUF445 family protein [Bacteroidales bacterium]